MGASDVYICKTMCEHGKLWKPGELATEQQLLGMGNHTLPRHFVLRDKLTEDDKGDMKVDPDNGIPKATNQEMKDFLIANKIPLPAKLTARYLTPLYQDAVRAKGAGTQGGQVPPGGGIESFVG